MDIVRNILMGIGCLGLLYLGSCTLVGVSSVVAINEATSPENLERLADEAEERENARHNEEMNEEAAYGVDRDRSYAE